MPRRRSTMLAGLILGLVTAGCSKSPATPTAATPTSLSVSGNPTLTGIGQTSQFTATASMSDGSTQDVTSRATWQSGNPAFVTVSSTGLGTGVGYGETAITATYSGKSASLTTATVMVNLTGNWTGVGRDSSGSSSLNVALTQSATTVSGSANFTVSIGSGTGTFSGTVNPAGTNVNFAINANVSVFAQSCAVSYTGSGQLNGSVFTGTYTGTTCAGNVSGGQITLTRQ